MNGIYDTKIITEAVVWVIKSLWRTLSDYWKLCSICVMNFDLLLFVSLCLLEIQAFKVKDRCPCVEKHMEGWRGKA